MTKHAYVVTIVRRGYNKLPSIFNFLGYKIYFWTNENNEPIHVHISKGSPNGNATKIWITSTGDVIVSHNKSRIPKNDLNRVLAYIRINAPYIVAFWIEYFGGITYIC